MKALGWLFLLSSVVVVFHFMGGTPHKTAAQRAREAGL